MNRVAACPVICRSWGFRTVVNVQARTWDSATDPLMWRMYQAVEVLPEAPETEERWRELRAGWQTWQSRAAIPVGTPYLMSPEFGYDIELNAFFYSVEMLVSALTTRVGYARDVKAFLNFLTLSRGGCDWRDASEEDHRAYLVWRREDRAGPHVSDGTWDREVSALNRFYKWQTARGHVPANPIPQRSQRTAPGYSRRGDASRETAATYSHGRRSERIEWFPAESYRLWRDVGIRGYTATGVPDPTFRGRWASRNSVFVDLMVRTGLRLSEQSSLLLSEIPEQRGISGYQRLWLPASIAKGGSARWIYLPSSVSRDLATYIRLDRGEVVDAARAAGRYDHLDGSSWVVEQGSGVARRSHGNAAVKVEQLTPSERRLLFVETEDGLEPAALWLSEYGLPVSVSTWKDMFTQANRRCTGHGVDLHGHAHMLRHTFAVLTLEQMQRGHIASLSKLTPEQRGYYTRIFGDPLDWVRQRLGHRSVVTTQIYLHALEQLEMETRMALISDTWEDPRDPRALAVGTGQPDRVRP